jgi:hypothetical protein
MIAIMMLTKKHILGLFSKLLSCNVLLVYCLLAICHHTIAQHATIGTDSLQRKTFWGQAFNLKDRQTFKTEKPTWSFLFKFDDRETFIRQAPVDETGFQVGLQRRNWKFWVGYSYIKAPTRKSFKVETKDTIRTVLNLQYLTIAPEYIVVYHKFFELSTSIGLGFGESSIERTIGKLPTKTTNRFFFPLEPALKLVVKPTRWVGLSGSIGYRKTLSFTDSTVNYDGLFYSYGVSFFIGNMIEDTKYWLFKK